VVVRAVGPARGTSGSETGTSAACDGIPVMRVEMNVKEFNITSSCMKIYSLVHDPDISAPLGC